MNSDIIKPEKFGHLQFVYLFTVPLRNSVLKICSNKFAVIFRTSFLENTPGQLLLLIVLTGLPFPSILSVRKEKQQ